MTTPAKKRAICFACGADFEFDWVKWAQHQLEKKDKAHRKNRLFAHKILTNAKKLNQKRDLKPRTAMPENIKSHFDEIKRIVSGEMVRGQARCPNCKGNHITEINREYLEDDGDYVWRNTQGELMVLCVGCRR